MFVVRLGLEGRFDFKAFEHKADAVRRFWGGWVKIEDYDGANAALYQIIDCQSHREAVELVKTGDERRLVLLDIMPSIIDIDLSELELKPTEPEE